MIGLILCGGLGTRLKEETKDKPKCMVEVGGKPVLERVADHMNKHGIWRIVVNLHAFPEVVMKHFGQRFLYLYEPVPMGEFATTSLVKAWFPDEPLVVMNGDTLTDLDVDLTVRITTGGTHIGTSVEVPAKFWDIGTPKGLEVARKEYANQ